MPLTSSPISSPSLRAIAHAQARPSYFPAVPNAMAVNRTQYARTPTNSMDIHPHPHPPSSPSQDMKGGSPLIGCLKHTNRPVVSSPISEIPPTSTYPTVGQSGVTGGGYAQSAMRSTNPSEKRRASMGNFKVSHIPLCPTASPSLGGGGLGSARGAQTLLRTGMDNIKTQAQDTRSQGHSNSLDTRRRPSFRIEIPARPVPVPVPRSSTSLAPSQGQGQMTEGPLVDSPIIHQTPIIQASPALYPSRLSQAPAPVFRDPFASQQPLQPFQRPTAADSNHVQGERRYVILRAQSPTLMMNNDCPSPTQPAEEIWPGMVGLGYSLNRIRAPTPWLRDAKSHESDHEGEGEDNQWIRKNEGVREVEGEFGDLGLV